MRLAEACDRARRWVIESARRIPGVYGAYTAGSTNWLSPDADLPTTSDLDIVILLEDASHGGNRGKFAYEGVLLDVSYLSSNRFQSPAFLLGDYHIAPSFATATILLDTSGDLGALLALVRRDYAKRQWVRQRCANAHDKVLHHLDSIDSDAPLHDQVMAWLFGAGVTTHVLLSAGLRNPTIRTRYAAVRQLLGDRHQAFYETLLGVLGVAGWTPGRVNRHLATLTDIFDRAMPVARTSPLPFAADISASARVVTIDGNRELIGRGLHREAMFWIAVTHSRCQKVISEMAPLEMTQTLTDAYLELVDDLHLSSAADIRRRRAEVESILPRVLELAELIAAEVTG
jgi:hypothetical protein